MYRGRQVIDVATSLRKKEEKRKRKEQEMKGLNVTKKEKTKVEPKKDVDSKIAKDPKGNKGFNLFRRTPAAKSGDN